MGIIHGAYSHLTMAVEDVWGVANGLPAYIPMPCDSYGPVFTRQVRNSDQALGIIDEVHQDHFNGGVAGQIVIPWMGWEPPSTTTPLAKTIWDWGFSNAVDGMPSYMCEWAEGPDVANILHSGMRVNQITLAGDSASNRILFTLDVMGQNEAAVVTAQTQPDDWNSAVEANYMEILFTLGGSAIKLSSFSLSQQNNLVPLFNNGAVCDYLVGGKRARMLQMVPFQTDDVYGAYNRIYTQTNKAATIIIKGRHNGTGASGTFWTQTISLGKCGFVAPENPRAKEVKKQPLNFKVLKPQSSTAAIVSSWALTS